MRPPYQSNRWWKYNSIASIAMAVKVAIVISQSVVMHVGMKQLNKLIKHDLVRGLKDVTFEKDKLCSACQARK